MAETRQREQRVTPRVDADSPRNHAAGAPPRRRALAEAIVPLHTRRHLPAMNARGRAAERTLLDDIVNFFPVVAPISSDDAAGLSHFDRLKGRYTALLHR